MNIIVNLRDNVRKIVLVLHKLYLTKLMGMHVHKTALISFGAKLDRTNPKGVYIGKDTYVASGAIIFAHDFSRDLWQDTIIGEKCFIGSNAIIMCGLRIGDECIIGSGAIVTKNVPSHCIVAGNPARIIREGILTKRFGQLSRKYEH